MRSILSFLLLVMSLGALQAQSEIVGTWLNEAQEGKVTVESQGDMYEGKLTWTDVEGGEKALGTVIFKSLQYQDGKWIGQVYSLRQKDTYDAIFELAEDGKTLLMKVSVGFFSRTKTWTRVD